MQINFNTPKYVLLSIDGKNPCKLCMEDGKASFDDVEIKLKNNCIFLKATSSLVSHIYLAYDCDFGDSHLFLGDSFERGYGDMGWKKKEETKQLFWYFFADDKKTNNLSAFGVGVQPNSIVSYKIKNNEIIVDVNVQSGGSGVNLEGRMLKAATFFSKEYHSGKTEDNCREFLSLLMGDIKPLKTKTPVYGFNNWYYAYGESNYQQIIKDTKLLCELSYGIKNRPYMVIDDGWSINPCSGPWTPNEKFKDMKALSDEIKSYNVIPGIWFRPLKDLSSQFENARHPLNHEWLDPTSEEVLQKIKKDVERFVGWGYRLIKFDFVTVDIYTKYGFQMDDRLTTQRWKYLDNHHTNAEIIMNLYKVIRNAAGDCVLIGCNSIPHLCAGVVEINRIGDDTSGFEWERVKKYGVNSLAFRLIQNKVFYDIDADCVGIMGKIDWKKNRQWLDVLSKSGSPLFVSCDPDEATEEIKKDIKKAFSINSSQKHAYFPLDWQTSFIPKEWADEKERDIYDWN